MYGLMQTHIYHTYTKKKYVFVEQTSDVHMPIFHVYKQTTHTATQN